MCEEFRGSRDDVLLKVREKPLEGLTLVVEDGEPRTPAQGVGKAAQDEVGVSVVMRRTPVCQTLAQSRKARAAIGPGKSLVGFGAEREEIRSAVPIGSGEPPVQEEFGADVGHRSRSASAHVEARELSKCSRAQRNELRRGVKGVVGRVVERDAFLNRRISNFQ